MPQLILPADELNEFDLPRVCVVTGQTEGVDFKPVKFAWYPRWIVALIIINVLIAAIVAQIMTRRVKGQLPFTPEAYKAWRMGQVLFVLSIVAALGMFVGGIIAATDSSHPELGGALILLALLTPILTWAFFFRNKGPQVLRIADGQITLKLPSEEAVLRIQEHLRAGLQKPSGQRGVLSA